MDEFKNTSNPCIGLEIRVVIIFTREGWFLTRKLSVTMKLAKLNLLKIGACLYMKLYSNAVLKSEIVEMTCGPSSIVYNLFPL